MLKSTLGIAIALSLCAVAHAADQGHGIINFKGTVIDAPCGIAQESAEQTIDFGQISKEGANKRGNSSRLTQSFHFFMFEPIFSPVNALNQPI